MKKIINFIFFVFLFSIVLSPVKAELLGAYIAKINKWYSFHINLNDTTKSMDEIGPSECEKKECGGFLWSIRGIIIHEEIIQLVAGTLKTNKCGLKQQP